MCSNTEVPLKISAASNVVISDCVYVNCPQLILDSCSSVTISNVTFRNGNSSSSIGNGGSLQIIGVNSIVNITSSIFQNNRFLNTSGNGGAIYAEGSLTVQDSVFSGNLASSMGGAIYLSSCALFSCTNCVFSDNVSTKGGAISVDPGNVYSPAIFIANSVLTRNIASVLDGSISKGGSIYLGVQIQLTISNSSFIENSAFDYGGGIHISLKCRVSITSTLAVRHTSINGYGAFIYVNGGLNTFVTITNSLFSKNLAQSNGGSFYLTGDANILIENSDFSENQATFGGAFASENVPIAHPLVFRNCSFERNVGTYGGGGIHTGSTNLYVENCIFVACSAGVFGGALECGDSGAGTTSRLTTINCKFFNCSSGGYAGSVIVTTVGNTLIQDSYFEGSASKFGGCFWFANIKSPQVVNCTFVRNQAYDSGGDIICKGGSSPMLIGSRFYYSYSTRGGAISAWEASKLTVTGCSFYNCKADQYGGSIDALSTDSSSTISISKCAFYNSSSARGGAISARSSPYIEIKSSIFIDCSSGVSGGAVFFSAMSTATINSCFSLRTNSGIGGFVYAESVTAFSILNNQVTSSSSVVMGGSIHVADSGATFFNSTFDGSKSISGGTIAAVGTSTLSGSALQLNHSEAWQGGAVYVSGSVIAILQNCLFFDSVSNFQGSLLHASSGCQVSLLASILEAVISNDIGGSCIYSIGSQVSIFSMDFSYFAGQTGALLSAVDGSTVNLFGINSVNLVAFGIGGSVVMVDTFSSVAFTDSYFDYPKAEAIFSVSGGSYLYLVNCELSFSNQPIAPSSNWKSQSNRFLFFALSDGTIELTSSSAVISFTGENVAKVATTGSFVCSSSFVNSSRTILSPIFGSSGSQITLSGCSIVNSSVLGSASKCDILSGIASFGGAVRSSGNMNIQDGSVLQGNTAQYGGALYVSENGFTTIGDNVVISGNTGLLWGGAFHINSGEILLQGSGVNISGNNAVLYPVSTTGYVKDGYIDLDVQNLTIIGGIYVKNHLSAEYISENTTLAESVNLQGRSKRLEFSSLTNGTTIRLPLSKDIPSIQISALDGFNQVAMVDPANLVIVEISEINYGATLKGETKKSIADQSTGMVTISSLSIPQRIAATYTLKFSAKEGTLDTDGPDENPLFLNIVYYDCIPGAELFIDTLNSCVPIVRINNGVRLVITILCTLLLVGCIATLVGLNQFRTYHLIKANSYVYLSVPVLGCFLAFLSPIISQFSCIASSTLENLGFTLIFASLIIKLYRIRILFGRKVDILSKETVKSLTESALARYLYAAVLFVSIYQILWGMLDNPQPVLTYIPSEQIVISDKCRLDSYFVIGMAAIKFIVSIIVSYLAFINRNVPSDFNEAKYIGFACYNWVIFGTFISLTSQFIISDPHIGFLVKGLSLILSHSYTTLFLASYKVYRCWRYPAETKSRKNEVVASTKVPTLGNSKSKDNKSTGGAISASFKEASSPNSMSYKEASTPMSGSIKEQQ